MTPDRLIPHLSGDYLLIDKKNPTDRKWEDRDGLYEFGSATFWHPRKFCIYGPDAIEYDDWFVSFLEKNNEVFLKYGAETYHLFMEVYYDGGQCNFEILNKDFLKRISRFNVSLPISVHKLTKRYHSKWIKEIEPAWIAV